MFEKKPVMIYNADNINLCFWELMLVLKLKERKKGSNVLKTDTLAFL